MGADPLQWLYWSNWLNYCLPFDFKPSDQTRASPCCTNLRRPVQSSLSRHQSDKPIKGQAGNRGVERLPVQNLILSLWSIALIFTTRPMSRFIPDLSVHLPHLTSFLQLLHLYFVHPQFLEWSHVNLFFLPLVLVSLQQPSNTVDFLISGPLS